MSRIMVSQLLDDNKRQTNAFAPSSESIRITGIETTVVNSGTTISPLVRIVATAAVNYVVTTEATSAVVTSSAYLPANTIELVKLKQGVESISFLGSSIIYITSLR